MDSLMMGFADELVKLGGSLGLSRARRVRDAIWRADAPMRGTAGHKHVLKFEHQWNLGRAAAAKRWTAAKQSGMPAREVAKLHPKNLSNDDLIRLGRQSSRS